MDKVQELKTIKDIMKAVNPENLDNFIIDFKAFLALHNFVDAVREATNEIGIENPDYGTFRWIDDGKNDAKITIQVKS